MDKLKFLEKQVLKIVEMFKKMYWKLKIICLSFKWCWRINLGDEVFYKNNKYIVYNGVRSGSWRLGNLDNDNDGWVKRAECKKVWTLQNIIHSYKSGYRFYMTSWYDIWTREGIKDWMRNCNIW